MTAYTPGLFESIAKDVATGRSEQYLFAKKGTKAPVLMFSKLSLEEAVVFATSRVSDSVDMLITEYCTLHAIRSSPVFDDGCSALLDVDGILVELQIKKIALDEWRVLFSRVDAAKLYGTLSERLDSLEQSVYKLQRAVAEPA